MDRQVRRLGIAFVALFGVLFAQVAYVQVVAADEIANEPGNAARQIRAEYQVERGRILAADRRTVLAESLPNPDPNSPYAFVRPYPQGELYGQLTGYYSRIYGRSGLEQAMNPYLSGTAPEFTTQNLTDIILGRPKQGGTVITTLVPESAARRQAGARQLPGRGRRARPPERRHPRDVLEPGLRPEPITTGTDAQIEPRLEAVDERSRASARRARLPGPVPARVDVQDGHGERGARERLGAGEDLAEPAPSGPPRHRPHTSRTSATSYCTGGCERVTMEQAFVDSCNVPFAEIGMALEADKLAAQAQAYGFCQTDPTISLSCRTTRSRSSCRGRSATSRRRRTSTTTSRRSRARRSGSTTTSTTRCTSR